MKSLRIFQWDTIFLVVCVFVIIAAIIVFYWSFYFAGYGTRPTGVWEAGLIFLGAAGITLVALVVILGGAIRYFLRKEIGLGLSRIAFCIIPVLVWFTPLLFFDPDPFTLGFYTRVSETVDAEELLTWADEQFRLHGEEKDYTARVMIGFYDEEGRLVAHPGGEPITQPEGAILTRDPPDSLKELGPFYYIDFGIDEEGRQMMSIVWGSGFGHWGLLIDSSDFNENSGSVSLIKWQSRLWVVGMLED